MDVRCERCRAQYAFEDDQITPAGVTVQCNACGHVFRVKKKELVVSYPVKPEDLDGAPMQASQATTPRPPAPRAQPPRVDTALTEGPPAPPAPSWTIRTRATGQTLAFSELTTLQRWIVERKVGREDEVTQGDGAWVRLGTLAELQSFFEVVEAADRATARRTSLYPATPYPPPHIVPPPPPPPPAPPPAVGAPPPARREATPPGSIQIDLGESGRPAVGGSSRTGNVVAALLLLAVAAAAVAYVFMPGIFGRGEPPPPPPPVQAAPPPPVAVKPPEPPPPEPPPSQPEPQPVARPVEPEQTPEPPAARAPEPTPDARPRPKPPSLKQQLAEAGRLREGGRTEQGLELYGRILSQDPDNVEALAGRGLCYFDLEQYAPAEASLQEALRRSPTQADALLGLGETYRATGRKAEAIAMFERYLTEHPEGDEAPVARNAINQLKE